ncbi:metallophosphoesterase family protein [Haloterrigena sp. SYSU A558-1]|uniref:Phosphoesterase n=1 Tax=Haloterrigena gelatinilytica TaxID=2741724 RepID=A0A8J8GK99_9EURY|nr:metallophosphoesterase family protein [Haloterrigena gelatinilytica]NUB89872.1 metallophosphoesterase family protein [Haloterrigena gelatinilytica]NUC74302.1 metallophosphoesterase family protein [Haloterrigena gelatinilytica]
MARSRVAIVSDTHVPTRERSIPDWVVDEIERADHAIHAGDFDSNEAYERLVDLAGGPANLTAVRGNTDPATIDVPTTATLAVDGVTFVVTHGTGSPRGWHERVVETARSERDGDQDPVAVAGHTHEVVDTTVDGVRVLNPGSATGASPADRATMLVATVEDGSLAVEERTG